MNKRMKPEKLEETKMANQTDKLIKGGSFLIEDVTYEQVFTPEDYSDEHKMIAKTTEDYVLNEVVPVIDNLEITSSITPCAC